MDERSRAVVEAYRKARPATLARLWVKTRTRKDMESLQRRLRRDGVAFFSGEDHLLLVDDPERWRIALADYRSRIAASHSEVLYRNSRQGTADISSLDARVEQGAVVKESAALGKDAVVLMGAVVHIGAVVGDGTMIDMNAVVGSCARIGKNCHIGAGSVVAGVLEPPWAGTVVIEDDVVVGAGAVVLEGVRVGRGSVIAAGAVVTGDVPPFTVAGGVPARRIKTVDETTRKKTAISKELRDEIRRKAEEAETLDEVDERIIKELARGTAPDSTAMAKAAGTGDREVAARLQRLTAEGFVDTLGVRVNTKRLIKAFLFVRTKSDVATEDITSHVGRMFNVLRVSEVTGEYDLVIEVYGQNPKRLNDVIEAVRAVNGVVETLTSVVVREE